MDHLNGDIESQANMGSLLQLAPAGVTGSRANFNTLNTLQSFHFRKYSIYVVQNKDLNFDVKVSHKNKID